MSVASVVEQTGQAVLAVAAAGPPDRSLIALHLGRELDNPRACCEGQDDARPLDLEEGRGLAVSDLAQDRFISGPYREWDGFSTTHGRCTRKVERDRCQRTSKLNSLRFL